MNEPGLIARAAKALSQIEKNELKATLVSMLLAFILMASYFVLRPVRDAMPSDWSNTELSILWWLNFLICAAFVSVFGYAVSRARLRNVVAILYVAFAATFVILSIGVAIVEDRASISKLYYLWVSVFALFNTSVFWTFMTDMFTREQSKRLFPVIAAGASAGAFAGPLLPLFYAEIVGIETLIFIASIGLLLGVPLIFYLYRLKGAELGNVDLKADTTALGGKWWQGFRAFATSPYMLGIAAFILLYTFISSFVYFEQKNVLADIPIERRTQLLSLVDLAVNSLTYVLALFVTGRIVLRLGMPLALVLMPVLICLGMLILAIAPIVTVVLALQVFRRAGNYGLTKPARETLFTKISPEVRFKAKPVIDIVVYRGGDAVAGSLFSMLTDKIGLGLAAMAAIGSGIAALWAWVGAKLGRRFDEGESEPENVQESKQSENT